ncbi:MAG: flagellar hook-associated protein 3 FlgL [Gammaproteobacteria bacterium]
MRISTAQQFRQGLNAIQSRQTAAFEAKNRLASGKNILTPSDDPAGTARVLDLQRALALNRQYESNADTALGRLSVQEVALAATTDVLQRVRELTLQANNGTLTNAGRQAIGEEIGQRLNEVLGIANTKGANNEFLFAGFSSNTRPFSESGGTFSYHGDEGQRFLSLGAGFDVAVSDSGTSVFRDIPNGNGVFRALDNSANTGDGVIDGGNILDLGAFVPGTHTISFPTAGNFEVRDPSNTLIASGAFVSGEAIAFSGIEVTVKGTPAVGDVFEVVSSTPQDVFTTLAALASTLNGSAIGSAQEAQVGNALNRAIVDIDQAMEHISRIRSSVGSRLNATETERFIAEDFTLQIQSSISAIEDVDVAEAVSQLTQQKAGLEAAQQSFAAIQNLSLFDFLR